MIRPKYPYIRSPALLKACRALPCQQCGAAEAEAAHSNQAAHGKGRAIKADDNRIAALCHWCHMQIDQGQGNREANQSAWQAAHVKTVREMVRLGLWPVAVPVPDIRRFEA